VLKIRLLHALSRRGARRQMGTWWNLRKVGLAGLAGATLDVLGDVGRGWQAASARAQYQIERITPSAALEGRVERVPIAVVAALAGVGDFLDSLPQLSARRTALQAARRRTDAEILEWFGGNWRSAVPSAHHDLHALLREEVIDLLGAGKL
jgi:hypothetical protein